MLSKAGYCPTDTPFTSPRFLRATRWNAANCIKKLEATLKWRREYGIYDTLTAESIQEHVRANFTRVPPI